MTELTVQKEVTQVTIEDKKYSAKNSQASIQNTINALRGLKDDAGQIVELTTEEKTLVAEFFAQFLKFMLPIAQSIPISVEALKNIKGDVVQANIDPTGHLMIIYPNKNAELEDLSLEKNRNLLLSIIEDALPKFSRLIKSQKQQIEERISFLSAVTKEMQEISEAFNSNSE